MPPTPRLRQLRRDKALLPLLLNVLRLDVEEDDRLARHPALRTAPDADLHHLRQMARYWLGLAAVGVMRNYRCAPQVAVGLLQALRDELHADMPEPEIRAVSLRGALDVPPERLPAALRPPAPSTAPGT